VPEQIQMNNDSMLIVCRCRDAG